MKKIKILRFFSEFGCIVYNIKNGNAMNFFIQINMASHEWLN